MRRSSRFYTLIMIVAVGIAGVLWYRGSYGGFGYVLLIIVGILLLRDINRKKITAEELCVLTGLSACGGVMRVVFAFAPNISPLSFLIIMTGGVLGPECGGAVGMLSALISNIFLGQGPWTPWQMLGWGLMGVTSGILFKNTETIKKQSVAVFGFIWGFIFDWIMNLWIVLSFLSPPTWGAIITTYSAGLYFDLLHALSNVFFALLMTSRIKKTLYRIKDKTGVFSV